MGRPPCCEKVGIKKGPWTPEEDIVLVSYVQQHGPGNWRSVPTNTGLLRCSKSCRLRWTNYLRPGIKRGNFTPHEEGIIIHLQALLGNKWAAIASYLPQRTDNDIKNFWNTHLKKKIKKLQSALEPQRGSDNSANFPFASKNFSDKSGSCVVVTPATSTYASSTGNISRLLEGWMRSSSSPPKFPSEQPWKSQQETSTGPLATSNEDLASILSTFDHHHSISGNFACDHQTRRGSDRQTCGINDDENKQQQQRSGKEFPSPPLSFLESWVFGETSVGQVEEEMVAELPPIFS